MSLTLVQATLRQALLTGAFSNVQRDDIENKNWLYAEHVSRQDVVDLLQACTTSNYSVSNHHAVPGITVHTFTVHKTVVNELTWYLKIYY
jgi:hypothetical protein